MSTELIDAANEYLALGLSVIALNGKMPNGKIHRHGLHDAFQMSEDGSCAPYLDAFSHSLTTGIGILTNYPYFVVDIDGEDGAAAWRGIAGDEFMPDRWVAKTGRGLHLWYADTTPRRTRKLAPLLDLKAIGGYVAAPPSLHPDGHRYTWLLPPGHRAPEEAPAGLLHVLDNQDWEQKRRLVTRAASKRVRHEPMGDGKFWASWGFEGLLKAMREADDGNRNHVLYWAACTMMEDDATEEDFEQLHEAAVTAGLTARETRLTVRSARKAAASE